MLSTLAGLAEGKIDTSEMAKSALHAAGQGDFGLSVAQLSRIAEQIKPEQSAIIVLFENLWERKFREITAKHYGKVINQRLIGSDMLMKLGEELSKSAAP